MSAQTAHKLDYTVLKDLLLTRAFEEKMLLWKKHGKLSKWFSSIGQEAISVGIVHGLKATDYILPAHRNPGVFLARGVDLTSLVAQLRGQSAGYSNGKDRSFHFHLPEKRIYGMISHMAANYPVACGIGRAIQLEKKKEIAVAICGDGATSQGDFHEALNLAAVFRLPVLFVVENNGIALHTPTNQQYACTNLSDRSAGYGIPGKTISGQNVLTVRKEVQNIREEICKTGRPYLLEITTQRARAHEESLAGKSTLQDDPLSYLTNYDKSLLSTLKSQVEEALKTLDDLPLTEVDLAEESDQDVLRRFISNLPAEIDYDLNLVSSITKTLGNNLDNNPKLTLYGQDIADSGGVFGATSNLKLRFGERVKNTPLCESAVIGMAHGLALLDLPSVLEIQFADFISSGFNQLVNQLATSYYRTGRSINVTIRLPYGGGTGSGPFHSQSMEAWFMHVPGLVCYFPSCPATASQLLNLAIQNPNPVLIFEPKKLYRYPIDRFNRFDLNRPLTVSCLGGRVVRNGNKLLLITYGASLMDVLEELAKIDKPRQVMVVELPVPQDPDLRLLENCLRITGRALIVHEAKTKLGYGAELASKISEKFFSLLDAPVHRLGAEFTPVPFNETMERKHYPFHDRLASSIRELLSY